MTMMSHIDITAPFRPKIRIKFGFLARFLKALVQAHCHSREAQKLLSAHDAILKDVGLTRVKTNGNTYLF